MNPGGPGGAGPGRGVLGVGIDVVEHDRISEALAKFGDRFRKRVFCPSEIEYCEPMARSEQHYSGRFAVKEAVSKAFGTGIGRVMGWKDIEVCRYEPSGAPYAVLHGGAKDLAERRGVDRVWVSLAHGRDVSVAQAVLEGTPPDESEKETP